MKRLSILIAHEVPEVCARLSWWLRAHHTSAVHSARDATSASRLLHFDVVVNAMDLSLPLHFAVLQGIKHRQPWIRLLTVLGDTYGESRRSRSTDAMKQGANAILFHPFSERQLLLALRACWNDDAPSDRSAPFSLPRENPRVTALPQTPDHFP